jgi:hypothetical protein
MARKPQNHESVMDDIFASLEWHIFQHLKSADSMLSKVSEEAACFSVPASFRQEFIKNKVVDMIEQIAEQREGKRYVREA